MKATVLVDNKAAWGLGAKWGLDAEWGLSIYIEYEGSKILLDTGASGTFAANADKLEIDLTDVDFGVLSHAHYDHADGLDTFFSINSEAPFYFSKNACENCYNIKRSEENESEIKYDGIRKGLIGSFRDRIIFVNEPCFKIRDGVYILAHSTPDLEEIGERVGQYIATDEGLIPDNYSHEQSLVFRTAKGLVVFNSCSHAGVDNIINEVRTAFPGERLHSIIGGFHTHMFDEKSMREYARRIVATGVKHLVTGHCTGENQYIWLEDELKSFESITVEQMYCGMEITI